jgi:hypothetical protein
MNPAILPCPEKPGREKQEKSAEIQRQTNRREHFCSCKKRQMMSPDCHKNPATVSDFAQNRSIIKADYLTRQMFRMSKGPDDSEES